MGVASIKIEGRMKRPEYVAIVTRAYRTVLNGGKLTQADLARISTDTGDALVLKEKTNTIEIARTR